MISYPALSSYTLVCEPMKPAPPVTNTVDIEITSRLFIGYIILTK